MPSGSHDALPEVEIVPGYSSRLADWGGMTVAFEKAHKGQDASSMVKGLPDDRCQAPHWGFLFSGRIVVDRQAALFSRSDRKEGHALIVAGKAGAILAMAERAFH